MDLCRLSTKGDGPTLSCASGRMPAAEKNREWLAINSGEFVSALEDRSVTMARFVVRPPTLAED